MIGFTKALALENAKKGVTVNAIAPRLHRTEMLQAVPEKVLQGSSTRSPWAAWDGARRSPRRSPSWPTSTPVSSRERP